MAVLASTTVWLLRLFLLVCIIIRTYRRGRHIYGSRVWVGAMGFKNNIKLVNWMVAAVINKDLNFSSRDTAGRSCAYNAWMLV